MQINGIAAMC